jgi:hypothetical protein
VEYEIFLINVGDRGVEAGPNRSVKEFSGLVAHAVAVVDDHLQKKLGVSCAGAATDEDLD